MSLTGVTGMAAFEPVSMTEGQGVCAHVCSYSLSNVCTLNILKGVKYSWNLVSALVWAVTMLFFQNKLGVCLGLVIHRDKVQSK